MFSLYQSSGSAILALSCLEYCCEERPVHARTDSAGLGLPPPRLSGLLLRLTRVGSVVSKRGYRGGFALARVASKARVLDLVEAVETPACVFGLKVLAPSGSSSLSRLRDRLLCFQEYCEEAAQPFQWRFTRQELNRPAGKLSDYEAGQRRAA